MNIHPEPEPSEAEIQKIAYHLYVESGCVPGHDLENWLAAKELLKHHHGRSGGRPARRRAPTAPAANHS